MKYILFLLLICSTATAQTITPAQFRKSLDSVAALSRTADTRQDTRLTALERSVVTLRPGTVDSLNRLSVLLNDLSTRIAQQGASLSTLNATLAGNIATDRSQEIQLTNLYVAINWAREEAAEAQKAAQAAQDMINQVKQYLKALP